MKIEQARIIADSIVRKLSLCCDKIHIAGSVRRECPEVGDIEIVCQPMSDNTTDLFGNVLGQARSSTFISVANMLGSIEKGNFKDGKYCRVNVAGIGVDVFMPDPIDYFRILAIRTGSSEYSYKVLAVGWSKLGWCGTKDGLRKKDECTFVERGGKKSYTCHKSNPTLPPVWSSEEDFFQWLGIEWVEPKLRN